MNHHALEPELNDSEPAALVGRPLQRALPVLLQVPMLLVQLLEVLADELEVLELLEVV